MCCQLFWHHYRHDHDPVLLRSVPCLDALFVLSYNLLSFTEEKSWHQFPKKIFFRLFLACYSFSICHLDAVFSCLATLTAIVTVAGSCIASSPSCLALYNSNPGTPSGTYLLDIDGSGPIPAFNAYCDMTGLGGWTLVAIRAPMIQLFTETVYTPLTTAQASGRLQGNNIWSLSSTFPFQQLRYSNSVGNSATANFGSVTSLSALNAQYASYTCTATTATVTSTVSTLVNFYFRGRSGFCTPYDDGCDWAALAFATSSSSVCGFGDSWDTQQPWWVLSGKSALCFYRQVDCNIHCLCNGYRHYDHVH